MDQGLSSKPFQDEIPRSKPNVEINADTIRKFTMESEVLPLFENKIYDYARTKHYSLKTNEFLRRRWHNYIDKIGSRVKTPCQFPCADDMHFYNCYTAYAPFQSLKGRNFKMQVSGKADAMGIRPVTMDDMQAKTVSKPRPKSVKKPKGE